MRIRLTNFIIECSSLRIADAWQKSGRYTLKANSNSTLMPNYALYYHHCEELLDIIHKHFDENPHSVFDFRPYETEKAYRNTIGEKAITF
jgi:hypothetical protein